MPLSEQLSAARDAVRAAVPPQIFAAIGGSIDHLKVQRLAEQAAGVGHRPSLPILDAVDGRPLDLAEVATGQPTVLLFYRGGWCPYCNVTLRAYARALPDIQAAGAALVAVTPERASHAAGTAHDNDVRFPVVVDRDNAFARSLGLVFTLPDDLVPLYRDLGIDVADRNGTDGHDLPIPATYVLDRSGRVAWAHVNADFTARAEPAEVLAAIGRLPNLHASAA